MAQISNNIYYSASSLSSLRKADETINYQTRKIVPQANSKGDAFGQSTINFRFQTAGNQYIMLDRSFLVIDSDTFVPATVLEAANVAAVDEKQAIQPSVQKDVAHSWNMPDNLFSGYELKCGGFTLDSVNQNAPQVAACIKRLQKSGAWVDRFGKSCEDMDPSFAKRRAEISYDGRDYFGDSYGDEKTLIAGGDCVLAANGVFTCATGQFLTEINPGDVIVGTNNLTFSVISVTGNRTATVAVSPANATMNAAPCYVIRPSNVRKTAQASRTQHLFQPTGLGIWSSGQALPPSSYELVLRPYSAPGYKQSALESTTDALVCSASGIFGPLGAMGANTAEFNVRDIYLVLCVAERYERAPEKQSIVFDIPTVNVQPRQISGAGSITESFTVSKSTYAFASALQDLRAGTNTLYSPSKFVAGDNLDDQNNLTRFQISFDGSTRPSPEADFELVKVPTTVNNIATLGVDKSKYWSYANRNINDLALYDSGGSFADYENSKELGLLQYYNWPRMGTSVSTAVDVRCTYSQAFTGNASNKQNLLLFALSRKVVEIQLENGLVTSFVSQDA